MAKATRYCVNCGAPINHLVEQSVVPENKEARRDGELDRKEGRRARAKYWLPGTYGHADYELAWSRKPKRERVRLND